MPSHLSVSLAVWHAPMGKVAKMPLNKLQRHALNDLLKLGVLKLPQQTLKHGHG